MPNIIRLYLNSKYAISFLRRKAVLLPAGTNPLLLLIFRIKEAKFSERKFRRSDKQTVHLDCILSSAIAAKI